MTPTIHLYAEGSAHADPIYVWRTGDGHAYVLGNMAELTALHTALTAAMAGNVEPEPISGQDIAWGMNVDIPLAVKAAVAYGLDGTKAQLADSIRAAARRGAIRGAQQINGRWSLPRYTLRDWFVKTETERRGRPRT